MNIDTPTVTPPPEAPPPNGAPPQKDEAVATPRAGGGGEKMSVATNIFVVLFYAVIALVIIWYSGGREFLIRNWIYIAAGVATLIVTAAVPSIREKFRQTTAQKRIGAILVVSILFILAFIVTVFLIEPDEQAAFLRLIFIMVVCSLPAIMYYLFIATKKYSLLNEFIINLDLLGLLAPLRSESEEKRQNRVQTYVQKFESVYGSIPTDLGGFIIKPTDPSQSAIDTRISKSDASGFTFDTTTTLPVLLATLLIALGWLITLPPWDKKLGRQPRGHSAVIIETQSAKAAPGAQETENPPDEPLAEEADQPVPSEQAASSEEQPTQPTQSPVQAVASGGETEPKPFTATEKWVQVFTPVQTPVRFAFIGAYFFALQLLFRRYVRRDLRASAYIAVSLRIILAVIGIWVVVAAMEIMPGDWVNETHEKTTFASAELVLGFVVGVFPRVAWQVVQAAIKRIGSLVVPSLQTQLPVSDLDGLTVWHEARLEEEDIENIPNMATADIVDLLINTRFPPDRIIDWIDQAILYTHLGPESGDNGQPSRRALLRGHGIRTASALVEAYSRSVDHGDRDQFETILPGDGRNSIRSLVDAIGTNPNLKLIQTWRGLQPYTHPAAPQPV